MKLPSELLLLTLSILPRATTAPANLQTRSASFPSLRGLTTLSNDYSIFEPINRPTKFFHESTFSPHYDGRFASIELPHHTRLFHLRLMLKAYMDTMQRVRVRTWLMHGCLLGWWWNGRIMPWDTDIDIMVDERGMRELGGWWNMSVHHFTADDLGLEPTGDYIISKIPHASKTSEDAIQQDNERLSKRMLKDEVMRSGKKYLLEVNPNYLNASTKDRDNVIDARWIDTATGLFIDITTIHVQPIPATSTSSTHPDSDEEPPDIELYTKDQHAYSHSQIFPLRTTTFENILVHIPYDFEELLLDEYGPRALSRPYFRGWRFDGERHEWLVDGAYGEDENEEEIIMWGQRARARADYLMRVRERKKAGMERFKDIP